MINSTTLSVIAQRGPFTVHEGLNTVTLDPPVALTKGDFIAVQRLTNATSCGQPVEAFHDGSGTDFMFGGDLTGNVPLTSLTAHTGATLVAIASDTPAVRASVIPVVGSVQGLALFRTGLQLTNPSSSRINGKLVFHRADAPGSSSDPSIDYSIDAHASQSFSDVVAAIGQSGLGSLDIYATSSFPPVAEARVFSDAGAAGTAGFAEAAAHIERKAIGTFVSGNIAIPTDLTNFRLNLGIRTINAVNVFYTLYDANGVQVARNSTSHMRRSTSNKVARRRSSAYRSFLPVARSRSRAPTSPGSTAPPPTTARKIRASVSSE